MLCLPTARPASAIKVEYFPAALGVADLRGRHAGRDGLIGNRWKISIVPVGQPTEFIGANYRVSLGSAPVRLCY